MIIVTVTVIGNVPSQAWKRSDSGDTVHPRDGGHEDLHMEQVTHEDIHQELSVIFIYD